MIDVETPVRDWLRGRATLARMARIELAAERNARPTYPRVTVRRIADPRDHDLDGELGTRQIRMQFDVWSDKPELTGPIAKQLEKELSEMAGAVIDNRTLNAADVQNVFTANVERPDAGRTDSIDRLILDVMLSMHGSLEV